MATTKNRVINGTKAAKQNVTVLKAVGNNIKKIRCPKCKQQAHPAPNGKGGSLLKCPGCGLSFTMQAM